MSTVRVRRLGASLLAVGLLAGAMTTPATVAAAGSTIVVNTAVDQDIADAACTLREAISAANLDAPWHGCAGGTGTDTITFIPSIVPIYLATSLPIGVSDFVIDGGGIAVINAQSNAAVSGAIQNSVGAMTLRNLEITAAVQTVISVGASASMTLSNVYVHATSGASAIVNGGTLRIESSNLSYNVAPGSFGGAIHNSGSLTVADSTFDHNSSSESGAIYSEMGTATITRSAFTSNSTADAGGAIHASLGTLTVTDSSFDANTATTAGAIYAAQGTSGISRSTFTGNTSDNSAGAIYLNGGTHTISDSAFTHNSSLYGGAIFNSATMTLRRSTLESNEAPAGGGGGIFNGGPATITASTFVDNTASYGGGLYNSDPAMVMANVTFDANTGTIQGGALMVTDPMSVVNATLTRNTSASGGGLYAISGAGPVVKNSIVTSNTGGDTAGAALAAGSTANVVGPVSNLATYLDVAGAAANGGPTRTVRIFKASGSPFVNTGSAAACAASPVSSKDQRGATRPTACDIGAMELESDAPSVTSTPKPGLRTDTLLSGASARGVVTWKASDAGGAGVKRSIVSRSVNGGPWSTISSSVTTSSYQLVVASGKTYRFRVRAVDWDGNTSSWSYGPTFRSAVTQQTSSAVHYLKTWISTSSTKLAGGSARYAKASGASASYTFTGRSVAFVTTTGPTRGKAKIYINGAYVTTVDLDGMVTTYRVQAWAKTWTTSGTRTIKVVVVGTAGRPRVDVDAFAVIR
jgi:CSLREA domain-containing protein